MTHERSTIERALNESRDSSGQWNIGKAARALGASRRTLQNRMRSYGMARGKAGRRRQALPYGIRKRILGSKRSVPVMVMGGVLLGGALLLRRSRHA